jgi:two-component system, NarL family, sensor histidine kinase DevS
MAARALDENRLRRLLEVGRALVSELDREALLYRVLEVARELTGARYAVLGILDPEHRELERLLTSGIDETHRAIGDLPRESGILGELMREPKPLRREDFLGAPILVHGEARGSLYLTEKDGGGFDEPDQESLVVLAEWAAIAIGNAPHERTNGREELERAVRGLEATTAIARAVGGKTDLARVLELVVKRGHALVDARSLLILLTEGDELVVSATAGETGEGAVGSRIPIADSALHRVVRGGHAQRLGDGWSRVRLGLGDVAGDASTAMLVPLTFRGRTTGALVALDRLGAGQGFTGGDERLMRAFASSAAIAVATAQTVEAEQLRLTLEAAEQERGRWARELHDETLQGLGALQVLLTSALQRRSAGTVEGAAEQAVEQIEGEIEKLQNLITELRPAALDEIGLMPALESLVTRIGAAHGLAVEGTVDLDYEAGRQATRLEPEIESVAYRLVQEALTNAGKHARADWVQVAVVELDHRVSIEVRDDGRGFDPRKVDGGFGLLGMRERVDLLGGSLRIESRPGSGTTVHAELPSRHRKGSAPGARPEEPLLRSPADRST